MKIEKYLAYKSGFAKTLGLSLSLAFVSGFGGCKGTPFTFPTMNGTSSRVASPATGSYQVPGSYNGTSGAPANSGGGLGTSSFGNPPTGFNNKTSQTSLPISNFVNGISQAESQLLNATNNARSTVNRTADAVNNGVENAAARVDRFGQGVVQASNILTEAATAPIVTNQSYPMDTPNIEMPNNPNPTSGNVSDSAWRSPVRK